MTVTIKSREHVEFIKDDARIYITKAMLSMCGKTFDDVEYDEEEDTYYIDGYYWPSICILTRQDLFQQIIKELYG